MATPISSSSFQELVATDPRFRADFIADPKPVLAELGLDFPDSTHVHIVEMDAANLSLILGGKDAYSAEQLASMPPQVAAVIQRSFTDPEFKQLLVADPREAIFLETGYRLPDSIQVATYMTTEKDVYLPIAASKEEQENEELSDLQLEQVAGGKSSAGQSISNFFTKTIPNGFVTLNNDINNSPISNSSILGTLGFSQQTINTVNNAAST